MTILLYDDVPCRRRSRLQVYASVYTLQSITHMIRTLSSSASAKLAAQMAASMLRDGVLVLVFQYKYYVLQYKHDHLQYKLLLLQQYKHLPA